MEQQQRIRVLVADDSSVIRSLLNRMVEAQPDMECAGTAATGHEAIRKAVELQPDIVLMDIHMPDLDGIQAAWLVSSKLPSGGVIMVTSEERIDFLQKAMTAGAQAYILKPFGDGTQLFQAVREVYARSSLRRLQFNDPGLAAPSAPPKSGKRVAVFSAKGGVGRTTVAIGLANGLLRKDDASVVLFDADFLFGDANVHLELPDERSIVDLLPHINALDSRLVEHVLMKHKSGLALLARPPRPEQADLVTGEHVRALSTTLSRLYDYVVIDTQPSYDERMLAVLDLADLYVIVVTAQLGVLRNTRHFLEAARRLGYSQDRMCFVLNRSNQLGGLTLDQICSILDTKELTSLPTAGPELNQSINEGRPLVMQQPNSGLARALGVVADRVLAMARA